MIKIRAIKDSLKVASREGLCVSADWTDKKGAHASGGKVSEVGKNQFRISSDDYTYDIKYTQLDEMNILVHSSKRVG